MNASKASGGYEVKLEETERMFCLRCVRRARRWRTVTVVSQWVVVSGFSMGVGFVASQLRHTAGELDPAAECARAPQHLAQLDRAQLDAPKLTSAALEPAPLRAAVDHDGEGPLTTRPPHEAQHAAAQNGQRSPPSPTMGGSEPRDSEERQVRRVEDAPAESEATLNSDSTEVDEESPYPSPLPSVKSGDAGVDERPDSAPLEPARVARDAHKSRRLKQHLADGQRLLRHDQLENAELAFRQALALRRNHPQALAGLARLYLAKGDIDRAREFAQAAVDRAPHQAPYRVVLGDVLSVASDPQGAEAEYRLATRLKPSTQHDR